MPSIFKNFLNSEKAVASGVLMLAASAMAALGKMSIAEWQQYTLGLLGIYTAGKTIQGGISAATGHKAAKADAQAARAELESLKASLATNDAAADSAISEKFKEDGNAQK